MDYSIITELDISFKGITKLPDDIHKYTNLKKLNCYNNPLLYDFEPTLENIRKYNENIMQKIDF